MSPFTALPGDCSVPTPCQGCPCPRCFINPHLMPPGRAGWLCPNLARVRWPGCRPLHAPAHSLDLCKLCADRVAHALARRAVP